MAEALTKVSPHNVTFGNGRPVNINYTVIGLIINAID